MNQPKSKKRAISGWVVLNKPYDFTSTQAVGKVRWLLNAAKAGHAGTLDPLATGILPIALGEATKAVPQVQDGIKIYRFTIGWGKATSTDDTEGEVIATSDVRPEQGALEAVLRAYPGAVLFVWHDRAFIDAVADRIVYIADKRTHTFEGGYTPFSKTAKWR